MSKEPIYCEHCGASMVEYSHNLTANFVKILHKLWIAGTGEINIGTLEYTLPQRTNFHKLRYWDLVEPGKEKNTGVWKITNKGIWFLSCKLAINKTAVTYRGVRIKYEDKHVTADSLWKEIMYKTRPEYIETAEPHFQFEGEPTLWI